MTEDEVTDEDIRTVIQHANFGGSCPVETVKHGLLKIAADFHTGGTVRFALQETGLITPKGNLTKKGRRHLWIWFNRPPKKAGKP